MFEDLVQGRTVVVQVNHSPVRVTIQLAAYIGWDDLVEMFDNTTRKKRYLREQQEEEANNDESEPWEHG
jgi:hypothetical protein